MENLRARLVLGHLLLSAYAAVLQLPLFQLDLWALAARACHARAVARRVGLRPAAGTDVVVGVHPLQLSMNPRTQAPRARVRTRRGHGPGRRPSGSIAIGQAAHLCGAGPAPRSTALVAIEPKLWNLSNVGSFFFFYKSESGLSVGRRLHV